MSVKGQLQIEGIGQAGGSPRSLSIAVYPHEPITGGILLDSDVKPDGRFLLENVLPRRYRLEVYGLPENMGVAGVGVQDREGHPDAVDFPEGFDSVTMTVTVRKK